MDTLRVYMPAIVLGVLTVVVLAGADSYVVQAFGAAAFVAALAVCVDELLRRYFDERQGRHGRHRHP